MEKQYSMPRLTAKRLLLLAAQLSTATFVWSLILVALPIYLFFCPLVNTGLVDRLAILPIKEKSWAAAHEYAGVPCEQLTFPVKAGSTTYNLSGAFYKNPRAADVILVSHGNWGNLSRQHRLPQIACLLNLGHSVFIYDYEGFGVSDGRASYSCLARDGIAAFDYVHHNLGFQCGQIVLYGLSIGTGVTCEIARARTPKAIILDSAFTNVEAVAKHLYPVLHAYPSILFPEPRYDNLAYLRGKHAPVLILTPVNDSIVPPQHGRTLAEAAGPGVTFVLLPHSSHTFVGTGDEKLYGNTIETFMKQIDQYKTASKN
jgi:pimeloyl-ACP methyl ester carboxylesterase